MKTFAQFIKEDTDNNTDVFAYLATLKDSEIDENIAEWNAKMSDQDLDLQDKESWLRHYAGEIVKRMGELSEVVSVKPGNVTTTLGDKIDWVGNTLYDMARAVLK